MAKHQTKKKNNKSKKITSLQPKLKQKQRVLHRIKAFFRLINLLLFCASIYGFYLIWKLPFWNINVVELNGLSKVGYKYVEKFSPQKSYRGQNLLIVNPAKVSAIFNNVRVFKSVNTYRSLFPTTLTLNFEERSPYINIFDDNEKKDITIDEDGEVLTFIIPTDEKVKFFPKPKEIKNKLKLIIKNSTKNTKNDKNIENKKDQGQLIYLISEIKSYKLSLQQINVIKVIEKLRNDKKIDDLGVYNITDPKNITLQTEDNKILLGGLDQLIVKIKSINALEAISKNNKNELEYIDVRYWQNPVLKLKKGSDSNEIKKELHN
ncbi:MAG: hypothetical protein H7263_15070 [Candidatus Sericytochromatia bacterium]|nr:hypothetical protein [Candidatus Sericytochromatia bacterium]